MRVLLIVIAMFVIVFSLPIALATIGLEAVGAGYQNNDSETVMSNQEDEDDSDAQPMLISEQKQEMRQEKERTRAKNATDLQEMLQARQQEMNQEIQQLRAQEQNIYHNQNRVRLAVHALLGMENLTGGIGKNISEIANQFNNSVQATIRAEEKIQQRSQLTKFFVGGDTDAADEINQEVQQNQVRLQKLDQLREQCECDKPVRQMLQEQIQGMKQEQTRLQELVQNEKQNKGLFGWLFR